MGVVDDLAFVRKPQALGDCNLVSFVEMVSFLDSGIVLPSGKARVAESSSRIETVAATTAANRAGPNRPAHSVHLFLAYFSHPLRFGPQLRRPNL